MKNNIIDRFHDYQLQAMRTMVDKSERLLCHDLQQLLHGILGIAGEVGELLLSGEDTSNKIEEIGDLCWYVAACADSLNIDMEDIEFNGERTELYMEDLQVHTSTLVDHIKRVIYYGIDVDSDKVSNILGRILVCLNYAASECGVTLQVCLDKNIAKLKARYPLKFSQEQALQRDLRKERKALDGE